MFRILFATFVVCLQFSCNGAKKNAPAIRVFGEGKIRIKPDLINLTIHINFVQPRMADLLAYDDAQKSALTLCETTKVKLGKPVYLTNIGEAETGEPVYSNMGNINTFNKSYGGAGFKVSPEVLVFGRKVISEYRISDWKIPQYVIDDETAIKVTDGIVEVVSEGQWKLFTSDTGTTKKV